MDRYPNIQWILNLACPVLSISWYFFPFLIWAQAKNGKINRGVFLLAGEFGVVYRGNLSGWSKNREHGVVAVKTLKGNLLCSHFSTISHIIHLQAY